MATLETFKETTAEDSPPPSSVSALFEMYRPEFVKALPATLPVDRFMRMAVTEFRRTPKLKQCDPRSVMSAIMIGAQLGLEIGVQGDGWLVPYKQECQFIPGYQGLVKLAVRSGFVKDIACHVVYEHDQFAIELGTSPFIKHVPKIDGDRGEMKLAYGVAEMSGGVKHFDFMTADQIYAIRDRSSGYRNAVKYSNKDNPWLDQDYEPEMWRKTMSRRLCKQIPKSTELAQALRLDDLGQQGAQRLRADDVRAVMEGDFIEGAAQEPAKGEHPPENPVSDPLLAKILEAKNHDEVLLILDAARSLPENERLGISAAAEKRLSMLDKPE